MMSRMPCSNSNTRPASSEELINFSSWDFNLRTQPAMDNSQSHDNIKTIILVSLTFISFDCVRNGEPDIMGLDKQQISLPQGNVFRVNED